MKLILRHTVATTKIFRFLNSYWIGSFRPTYFTLNKLMFMVPFSIGCREQEKSIAQEVNQHFLKTGFQCRESSSGTVARGFVPYPICWIIQRMREMLLVNPLSMTKENLELGKKKYNIYCSPCHGYFGEGDSRLQRTISKSSKYSFGKNKKLE